MKASTRLGGVRLERYWPSRGTIRDEVVPFESRTPLERVVRPAYFCLLTPDF